MTNDDVGGGDDKQEESSDVDEDVTLLMLGEGDFTYSLDLARYYHRACCSDSCDILNNHRPRSQPSRRRRPRRSIHLIATGIDTYDSLIAKYKDTPFVLECLKQQQRQEESSSSESLSVVKSSSSDHDDDSSSDHDDPSSSSKLMLKLKRVSIHHCVNAIVESSSSSNLDIDIDNRHRHEEETKASSSSSTMMKMPSCLYGVADCVVFNHPHLGTEDAARHGRFLCHLFDSVRQWWLKSSSSKPRRTSQNHYQNDDGNNSSRRRTGGGMFCLTLVDGQYERWNCKYAAERHSFVLLDRRSFYPPPPSFQNNKKGTAKSYYEFRRHQTGKSFASRRPNCTGSASISGSETFTFAILPPEEDDGSSNNGSSNSATKKSIAIEAAKDLLFLLFPWQQQQQQQQNSSASCEEADTPFPPHTNTKVPLPLLLTCPYCDRTFKEERSRKSHVRDKHPNGADKKLRQEEDQILLFPCSECDRSFGSSSALQDHVRSKHSALHKNILPDWHKNNQKEEEKDDEEEPTTMTTTTSNKNFAKKCNICDLQYRDKTHEQNHLIEFDPTYPCQQEPSTTTTAFRCQFCSRIFREQRAKLQHENFCKDRKLPS